MTICISLLCRGEGKEKPDIFKPSIVPTDHFQDSLPRLAVPPLEKTCERYLASQRPLLNDQEYKRTEEIVNKFRDGEGKGTSCVVCLN